MTIAIAAIATLLVGLAVGLFAGIARGRSEGHSQGVAETEQRLAASATVDEARIRDITAAAIADSQQRLVELNAAQQREIAAQATEASVRQEKTVSDLVEPIDKKLKELDSVIKTLETGRAAQAGELREALGTLTQVTTTLNRETQILATAMKDNKARGNWGELQLKRVVELAGMVEHCDFDTQQHLAGDDRRGRPDLIVRLPQDRSVVVDSKVPMSAYWSAINAEDDESRARHLKQHSADVMAHVDALAKRDYAGLVDGPLDFVVMFVPGDMYLAAAFEARPTFFEDAIAKNVFPTSPGTLIALLRAIAYGWQQDRLTQNAEAIRELGVKLHDRIATFGKHFADVGKSLRSATEKYNESVGSLERMVLPSARQFKEMGVSTTKSIAELSSIDEITRDLSAAELTGPTGSEALALDL